MYGPGENELRKVSLSFVVNALLGREGRAVTPEHLRSFYASSYLERNPQLDADDAPYKAALLTEVCALAGVREATSLLEVGCGSGALLGDMKGRLGASRSVGVDYSDTIAIVGRARYGHQAVRADGATLPFRDGAFDLVYFADVVEHVLEPERFLREVARVGRRVAFLIPIEAGVLATPIYLSRRLRGKGTNYEQYGHIWRWSRPQIRRLLRAAGMKLDAYRCFQAPVKLSGMNRLGRLAETLRARAGALSPTAAEVLFGTAAFVGLAKGTDA
jgi:SAM-dependent methyltransferase